MKDEEEEGVKDEGEGMTWDCSFLREYSHQGPQDDGAAELIERYTIMIAN